MNGQTLQFVENFSFSGEIILRKCVISQVFWKNSEVDLKWLPNFIIMYF